MTPLAQVREALEKGDALAIEIDAYGLDRMDLRVGAAVEKLRVQLRAALSLLPSLTEGARWQPMETAPKDGIQILVYWKAGVKFLGATRDFYAVVSWGTSGDISFWLDENQEPYVCTPDAWFPLPPTDTEQEKTK